jgi:hypothetical protein
MKLSISTLALGLALAALVAPRPASATPLEGPAISVPFSFMVSGHVLPASQYSVTLDGEHADSLLLRNAQGQTWALTQTDQRELDAICSPTRNQIGEEPCMKLGYADEPGTAELLFTMHEGMHVLRGVQLPDRSPVAIFAADQQTAG